MCGITAIIGNKGAKEIAFKSLEKITHRGRKNFELAQGKNWALGANRLPIVDRENAKQPAKNENGTIFCVFNGEIYNHKELQKNLEKKGHKFGTESDTEALVHLYEQYGKNMLKFLDSEMYAFVIYDAANKKYFAARDEIGVKPLYLANAGESVYFASEIKQLAQFGEVKDIMPVMPGTYVENGIEKEYSTLRKEYGEKNGNAEKMAKKINLLLHAAVRKRVQTDLPIGVFLSGGLDSTAVLAIAKKYNQNITAIIAGKAGAKDREYAVRYCKENKIAYKIELPPNEKKLEKNIRDIIYMTESFEPNVIRNSMIAYHIAEAAVGFSIILCGEGADELFGGYNEFKNAGAGKINALGAEFLSDLHQTQCQRVDRTSMHFTEEVRTPFLDSALVRYAMSIPGEYKVRNGIEKWILRKAMENELPKYICQRKKVVLAQGAGYKGNKPSEGMFDEFISKSVGDSEFGRIKHENPEFGIKTKEEAFYFKLFSEFGFEKCSFAQKRPRVNVL